MSIMPQVLKFACGLLCTQFSSSGGAFYVEVCFDGPPISAEEARAAEQRKAEPSKKDESDVELF